MQAKGLSGAVPLVHFFLQKRLKPGDAAVDATCGNGQDTLLLAGLVGDSGQVWAFDIQEEALARTGKSLAAAGLAGRVQLIHAGHERISEFIAGQLKAAVFNLGYLPSGAREIRTAAATTLTALQQAAALLASGGIVVVAVYTGHDGGEDEWLAVKEWASALPPLEYNVWQMRQLNRSAVAPFLVVVERVD